ncbi:MAG: haloacid dehalogenase-like hydrolase [Oscillospiraceae bacterium]
MEKVNVYDFDKTILPYDSTEAFFKFCLRRHPRIVRKALRAVPLLPLWALKIKSKTEIKQVFYGFLTALSDVDAELEEFWRENLPNINEWYLQRRRPDDIVISASPDFLLRPVAETMGFRLIASRVGKYTGLAEGANNDGAEKVRRLNAEYPGTEIENFYSDSLHDSPLALLSERAYLVKDDMLLPWPSK